jgi:hypothetical protein
VPTLEQIIHGPGPWPDATNLDGLEVSMPTSTTNPQPREVVIQWTMAHGADEIDPMPETLRRVRELFAGGYAFKAPNGGHSQHVISVEWAAPEPGEAHLGWTPIEWINVAD